MDDITSFGAWIRRRRKALDLTQEALAARVAVSVAMIRRLEADERRPSREVAERLAQVLEVPPGEREDFVRTARAALAVDRLPDATAHAGASPAPAARGPSNDYRTNLPVQRDPLIGREHELTTVTQLIQRSDVGLVTLTGVGGTGKTRLALQVARGLVDAFLDGVWFLDLTPIRDPALVTATLAATLGVTEVAGTALEDTLAAYLRPKHLLLVLDNFEQIVAAAPRVDALLRAAPHLKLLVTSRIVLHLSFEQEYPVPPLPLPEPASAARSVQPVERLLQYPAIALFVQRTQRVTPTFQLTDANAYDVTEICRRLDGLPLAIELAAARVKLLPPPALLARLSQRLQVLTGGARDLPARQQTIRATIDWSYQLLPPAEQRLFTRLAVFVGGWTVDAVEAVCNPDGEVGLDGLDGLQALLDQSLLQQQGDARREPRFTMLETIREYALERLAARGEAEVVRERHAWYYLALAEDAEPQLDGPQQALWLERLVEDDANLRAALAWSRRAPGNPEIEARLALALFTYWQTRGHFTEAHLSLTMMPEQLGDPLLRVKALINAGNTALFRGDPARAQGLLETSLALARRADDRMSIAFTQMFLGRTADLAGKHDEARALLEASLAPLQEHELSSRRAWTLAFLGEVLQNQGQVASAMHCFREAYRIQHAMGNADSVAWAAFGVARVTWQAGDAEQAATWFEEALRAFRKLESASGIAETLCWMGIIATGRGDTNAAARLFHESLSLFQRQAVRIHDALVLEGMAGLAGRVGRGARAARLFGAADALREARGLPLPPFVQPSYKQNLAAARAQIDEPAWGAAWATGRAMMLEQAIAYALEDDPTAE